MTVPGRVKEDAAKAVAPYHFAAERFASSASHYYRVEIVTKNAAGTIAFRDVDAWWGPR